MDRGEIRSQGRGAAKALDKENVCAWSVGCCGHDSTQWRDRVYDLRVPDAAHGIGAPASRRCAWRAAIRRSRSRNLKVIYNIGEVSFLLYYIWFIWCMVQM